MAHAHTHKFRKPTILLVWVHIRSQSRPTMQFISQIVVVENFIELQWLVVSLVAIFDKLDIVLSFHVDQVVRKRVRKLLCSGVLFELGLLQFYLLHI